MLVIDYRNVAKHISHSIRSSAVACSFPTEAEEIGHRMMKFFFTLVANHPDEKIVLANDSAPYWRTKWIRNWYAARGLDEVTYKGNRAKQAWLFNQMTPEQMERLYDQVLVDAAKSIGAVVIQDKGLEADDIFGILAKTVPEVTGWSTDSDWAQLVGPTVKVFNFSTGEFREPLDIRIKHIGGDAGDCIPGCPKFKKDGERAKNGWGPATAAKLLASDPNYHNQLDPEHLEKNRILTTLPCPLWDLEQAEEMLIDCAVKYPQTDDLWDSYFVTAAVRQHLTDKSNRDQWVASLRLNFLKEKSDDES